MFNRYSKGSMTDPVTDTLKTLNEPESDVGFLSLQGGGTTSLGNTQVTVPDVAEQMTAPHQIKRKERYKLRRSLQRLTDSKRFKQCGHTPVNGAGVMLRKTETKSGARAGLAGLSTCGSVWLCPVCSSKVSAQRADEVTRVIEAGMKSGLKVYMATFTVRHDKWHSLEQIWNGIGKGWRAITSGRTGQSLKADYGLTGWLKSVEVTWSPQNGWHVHLHVLMFLRPSESSLEVLKMTLWKAWKRGISKEGLNAQANNGGFDFTEAQGGVGALSHYLTKQARSMAQEAVLGSEKLAKGENLTPFQIGAYAVETGDVEALEAWQEYARISRGKKQLTWSKGLRALADLEPEQSDEEIASQELGSSADDVLLLPSETWRRIGVEVWRMLDLLENEGLEAVEDWLKAKGLSYAYPSKE